MKGYQEVMIFVIPAGDIDVHLREGVSFHVGRIDVIVSCLGVRKDRDGKVAEE